MNRLRLESHPSLLGYVARHRDQSTSGDANDPHDNFCRVPNLLEFGHVAFYFSDLSSELFVESFNGARVLLHCCLHGPEGFLNIR